MIARVVTKRTDARVATFVTAAAAIFLLLVLADDAFHIALFRPPVSAMFLVIAVAMTVAGVGPWLAWSRRVGHAVPVRCADGVLQAGRLRIAKGDVKAVSVVRAARGCSVAVEHGTRVAFLEVERAEDAARIAQTLGTASAGLVVPPGTRGIGVIQMVVTLAALTAAPLYYLTAMNGYSSDGILPDQKALFGLTGVVAAGLSLLFLVMRQWRPNQVRALGGRSAWEVHAALHRERAAQEQEQRPAQEHEQEPPGGSAEHIQIGGLGRGDEGVGAWLTRIDAIPTEQHAYRGDALKKDVLWDALGDATATVDTRMAAARVLRRRYGEEEGALMRVVDDPDVRVRVEAALEEHDDAERRIESLGPLFRARRLS